MLHDSDENGDRLNMLHYLKEPTVDNDVINYILTAEYSETELCNGRKLEKPAFVQIIMLKYKRIAYCFQSYHVQKVLGKFPPDNSPLDNSPPDNSPPNVFVAFPNEQYRKTI